MRGSTHLFPGLVLLLTSISFAADAPSLAVPAIDRPPQIDGVLDDAVWAKAAKTDLANVLGPGKPAVATTVYLARDAANVYIAVKAAERPDRLGKPLANAKLHDDERLWEDDDIELFIDPAGTRRTYYQLIVNSKGVTWDAFVPAPRQPRTDWEPKYQVATKVGADGWSAEWALPVEIFSATATADAKWTFNVIRGRQQDPAQIMTWAALKPGDGGAHAPELFGTLENMPAWKDREVAFKVAIPAPRPKPVEENTMVLGFEAEEDLTAWAAVTIDEKIKEPPVKIDITGDGASSGKKALKLTFAGGRFPAVGTTKLPPIDWSRQKSLRADLTATLAGGRTEAILVIRIIGVSKAATQSSPWFIDKVVRLQAGKNEVVDNIAQITGRPIAVGGVQIFLVDAADGDVVTIDNLRLSNMETERASAFRLQVPLYPNTKPEKGAPTTPLLTEKIAVLGTDLAVDNAAELAAKLKDKWVKPHDKTTAQVEAEFTAGFDEFKKDHPGALLAILRRGQKGFDPLKPEEVYDGFADSYMNGHDPQLIMSGLPCKGGGWPGEIFMRHRVTLFRADLSSIPKGSTIFAAQFVAVRNGKPAPTTKPDQWSPFKPNMFVAEFCNRPWVESEVNAYEYAKGKLWNESNGRNWTDSAAGDKPDFDPTIIAHGQSQVNLGAWDFTEAVKAWTSGKHENHGFVIYSVFPDAMDYFNAMTSEAKNVQDRPALMVIYEPAGK